MKTYPAIQMFSKFGRPLAWAILVLGALVTTYCVVRFDSAVDSVLVGCAFLALSLGIRLGAELMEVVSDTLIPR
jgi:hypothetical protein